jgi:hypothetical protein
MMKIIREMLVAVFPTLYSKLNETFSSSLRYMKVKTYLEFARTKIGIAPSGRLSGDRNGHGLVLELAK